MIPKLASAWNNKGIDLDDLNNYDEAIKAWEKALEIKPQLVEAWNNKVNALKLRSHTTEADTAFAKAKELGYQG